MFKHPVKRLIINEFIIGVIDRYDVSGRFALFLTPFSTGNDDELNVIHKCLLYDLQINVS